MNVWRSGSSNEGFSLAVSVGPSLVPTASTTSASATTALAASSPKLPKTPTANAWVSHKTTLARGRGGYGRAQCFRQLPQRRLGPTHSYTVTSEDDRPHGRTQTPRN